METIVLYLILAALAVGILNTNYRSGQTNERVGDLASCLLGRDEAHRTGTDAHHRSAADQHGYPALELPPDGRSLNNEELNHLLERTAPACRRFLPQNGGARDPTLTAPTPAPAPPPAAPPMSTPLTTAPRGPSSSAAGRNEPRPPPTTTTSTPPAPPLPAPTDDPDRVPALCGLPVGLGDFLCGR